LKFRKLFGICNLGFGIYGSCSLKGRWLTLRCQ
jgi:hypothetical protein